MRVLRYPDHFLALSNIGVERQDLPETRLETQQDDFQKRPTFTLFVRHTACVSNAIILSTCAWNVLRGRFTIKGRYSLHVSSIASASEGEEHVEEIEEQEGTKERSTLGEGKRMESKLPLGGGLVYRWKGRGEKLEDETARVCGGEKIREEEERERGRCREEFAPERADGR